MEEIVTELVECPLDLKAMKPGIYDIPNEDYHRCNGISRSGISTLKISPLHFWDRYINPDKPPHKSSPYMLLGSVVHTLILEPDLFDEQYMVVKKVNGATKEGKAYKAEIEAIIGDKTAIDEELFEKAMTMVTSVENHEKSMRVLENALIERSIYWIDVESELLCKTRPDIWNDNLKILADLKTSGSPTPIDFAYEALKGDYHIQAAMQIDGVYDRTGQIIEDFCFIVIPNERPFCPYVYHMPPAMIDRGRREYKDALKVAKKCFQLNKWDCERELILPMQFVDHQLSKNSFLPLKEIYDVRISS